MRNLVNMSVLLVMAMLATVAHGEDQVALPTDVMDGLENSWTIEKNGRLTAVNPYGFACLFMIDDIEFPAQESATRRVLEEGIELLIGPSTVGPVFVTRKLFFGKGEGHVRFLEILENRSTTPVTVNVKIYGGPWGGGNFAIVWENEHCVVAAKGEPAVTEFVYGTGGHFQPQRDKKREIGFVWEAIAIQPQSKAVILHFCAVRPKREQALEFSQSFQVAPACVAIEASDLSAIVNYDPRTLGAKAGIEIFRGGDKDAFLLKSGDQLTGAVQNKNFRIQTSYAQLEFPATDIATIIYEGGANNIERIVVLNGDVFSGFILDPDVTVKLEAGPLMKIRKEKISKLGFRIRANEKEKYPVTHDVTLTNGDHFSGDVKNQSLKIGAAFGDMPVEIQQIAKIEFISKKGTVTEITLKNGDKVSGFLKDEDIIIDLDFGREVSIYQDRIEKIIFDKTVLEKLSGEALSKKEQEQGSR